ncbi:hypothetical protein [Corallococcus sp. CA053C]|uniref:hypothetical protein n=1 Tax=Corallococcus sp. CA053C TaxID=2316732 RepID=UPI0011C3EF6E|nr:hypothetical protein [Corallococcus sp. CA053C]
MPYTPEVEAIISKLNARRPMSEHQATGYEVTLGDLGVWLIVKHTDETPACRNHLGEVPSLVRGNGPHPSCLCGKDLIIRRMDAGDVGG